MHLALHQGSINAACGASSVWPQSGRLTMDPALVDCGNCVRTTLYRAVARVTAHVATIEAATHAH
jgi:hypothetical protein